jgi:hypothetical protein
VDQIDTYMFENKVCTCMHRNYIQHSYVGQYRNQKCMVLTGIGIKLLYM